MRYPFTQPTFWLEFRLLSDGLETDAVQIMPLTAWHKAHNPTFHLFSALPAELRLKVWEYLIAPRILGIACLYLEDGASSVELQRDELLGSRPVIRPSIPVLLHVSRETRALALKHYELSFEWKVPRVLAGADMRPPTLVPARSPALAPLTPPSPPPLNQYTGPLPKPSEVPNPSPATSSSHISSYHDLLGPLPETTTSVLDSSNNGRTDSTPENKTVIERRTSSPPRTWFNFDLDAVYLLGELEPCDSFGFNSPMTYFIPSQTARRVRKTAVSFSALRYGETGGQQIFGALFHVVDRFPAATQAGDAAAEVLVCVTERDEWTHALMGNETALVAEATAANPGTNTDSTTANATTLNVVQKIWRDWYRGAIVTSPLADLKFSLIREKDLEKHVYDFMVATPSKQGKQRARKGDTGITRPGA
ncbi:hypothetical protein F5B22DRAFT_274974 [Xylaria bambusicola]|uniref:uncharacterized protein n=1 Tax=Xylaria bambusicola TaxID=326684 RepID=UPI002007C65F|nr:uncharacterized protein F5B22DRAFT_274974 [Xylaria bambusicola]KAI0513151.1 hypothetical protein F5B22DRAFT_274974 [Xylaria bambusicola]